MVEMCMNTSKNSMYIKNNKLVWKQEPYIYENMENYF